MIVADFSTTTPLSKACSEIVLMDSMKSYFVYDLTTLCGIPGVYLTGTKQDWLKIISKAKKLGELDETLLKWTVQLEKILNYFVLAFEGKINEEFWDSLYKFWDSGSGGPDVTGWICYFYLYSMIEEQPGKNKLRLNKFVFDEYKLTAKHEFTISPTDFPQGIGKAPVNWNYFGSDIKLEFLGGVIGASFQESTKALVPQFGWAILHVPETPEIFQ